MNRPINFNAGPAAMPLSVLNKIHENLINWNHTDVSILEIGHRTPQFFELAEKLEASVRRLLRVPNNFSILFLPGGAQIQFAMVAMNLTRGFKNATYMETGYWSSMAIKEAQKYIKVHIAASSKAQQFRTIPPSTTWDIPPNTAFLHFTDNETIGGIEFPEIPSIDNTILVSDMSSNIFSRPIDFSRIGCVYACAQKNFGIAGMSLVIVHRDLLDRAILETPTVFHYATQKKNFSLQATPTTFAWYVALLICEWIEKEGGVHEMEKRSRIKSELLYNCIDSNDLYHNPIDPVYRSRMNIPFTLRDEPIESAFFKKAKEAGLLYLEGHRSVGGARASIYNALSINEVKKLIKFLKKFSDEQSCTLQNCGN